MTPTYFSPDSLVGGGERHVSNLARALNATQSSTLLPFNFEQTIFSLGSKAKLFVQEGVPIHVLPNNNSSNNPWNGTSDLFWKELSDYDLIHVHQCLTPFGVFCSILAKTLHKPLILTDQGGGNDPIMLRARGLELADGILAVSNFARTFVAPHFTGPCEVIIGPVDTDFFHIGTATNRNRRTAICVSRILPHKGIDRIIKALPPTLKLRVVGHVYDQAYYKMLKQMSIGKNVEFIHDADDKKLLALYQSSDLFLQGSSFIDCNGNTAPNTELMGLTTLEALACGLPVIVSDGGSLPELIQDPSYGRVFSTHEELVSYLDDFIRGAWPKYIPTEEARSYIINQYSYSTVGARVSRFYSSIYTLCNN